MNKTIQTIAWTLLIIGGLIIIYFLFKSKSDGYYFYGGIPDYPTTGQFGDFIGGVVGTIFALAGTLLIFLTLNQQVKQNKREAFESAFFQMVNLHCQNVSQLNYTKSNGKEMETAHHRKVFRIIFKEFIECYREVKKFSNSKDINDYILPSYQPKLQK